MGIFFSQLAEAQYPDYKVKFTNAAPDGYYFLNAYRYSKSGSFPNTYLTIFNNKGQLIYYRISQTPSDFKLLSNGLMSYFDRGKYLLMNSEFTIVDSVYCIGNQIHTDAHDFNLTPNGDFMMLGWEEIEMDMSKEMFMPDKHLGKSNAKLMAGVLQVISKDKQKVLFEWHAKDHMQFDDMDRSFRWDTAAIDWTHFNSVFINKQKDYLLSSKHLFEISKINGKTGEFIWRLGGMGNQFRFINDSIPFYIQHDVKELDNGNLLFFDNGSCGTKRTHPCRVVEYSVNEKNKSVNLLWSYSPKPEIYSYANGNVQELPNNLRLVNYGKTDKNQLMFEVINKKGEQLFKVQYSDTMASLRVLHYPSLPFSVHQPEIKQIVQNGSLTLQAPNGYRLYEWSTGETTQSILVKKPGIYFVKVPTNNNGFVFSKYIKID